MLNKEGRPRTEDLSSQFRDAIAAGRRRDYRRAVDILNRIVGASERIPNALLYLGRSYHALGEFPRAIQALRFFVRRSPESVAGHFFLGRSHLAFGACFSAIRHLKRAVEKAPQFAAAHGLLGLAYLKARRPERAIFCFARALEIDPQNRRLQAGYLNTALVLGIRLFYRGDLDNSARLLAEVLDQGYGGILPHLYLASIYRDQKNGALALTHLEAAIRMSPQDPFIHLQKALIHLSQGDKRRATEELRIGTYFLKTSASPAGDPMDIQRFIAVNLFREKRYREAVFYANRLLRRAYNDPPLHALVAESYRCLGELAKAKNHYTRAMEGDRDSREIRYGLLSVLWQSGLPEEVLAESTRLLTRHPEDGTGRYFHGLALSRTGAPSEQVLGELQRLIKERGPDPLLMSELGAAYARSGLPELAEGWFQRTLKLHANDAETLHSLARTYEALGNREKEREAWSRYLALRPDDRKARKQLLRLLLALEAFADAAGEIERILPHEPGNVKLKELLALCFRRTARFAEALVLLRELLDGDPRREDLMKAAVYCLDRIGARKAAIKALDGYQKSNGDTLSCTLMLGVLHFQQGDLERAAETFRRAISIAPHDWRANRNLGMVYRRLGNEEFARTFLASADRYRRAGGTTGAEAEPL